MKRNCKNRTTIRTQWNKSIMMLAVGIFIVVGGGAYLAVKTITRDIISKAEPMFSYIISNELNERNINDLINDKENSEPYKKIDNALTALQNKGSEIFNKIYVIKKNGNEGWNYIIEKSKENNKKFGEAFDSTYNEGEINEALNNNKLAVGDKKDSEVSVFIPIKIKNGMDIILGIDFNLQAIKRIQFISLAILIGLMMLSLFIIRFIVGVITKKQTKSITVLVDKMKEMADLQGDLTKRIEIDSNDEIGELAFYTNKMLDTIQVTLKQVNDLSQNLNRTTEDFTNSFNRTTEEFKIMNDAVQHISERIESQTEEIAKTSESVVQINNAIGGIADSSQQVTEQAITTSNNAMEGNRVMEKLEEHSKEIFSVVDKTSKLVKQLGDKSQEINGIADAIGAIASQTNLLALNASIEAARAGEQGKGFAVVAEEVRKLAEESAKSAESIFALIQEVREGIENAAVSMEHVSEKTSEQSQFVEQVTAKFNDIVSSINNVSESVEEVSASTEEMSSNINMITSKFENLASISEENSSATEEIASSIENQSTTIKSLSDLIKDLNGKSSELMNKLLNMKLH
ncbi:methyl-accepting chemotaxis protein [Clostridium tetanomorphum]|uniref:HAMP domain-containing protein n=1 Tax=Clostridium tetanomorphum TaxID=1553 RepID=A0A923EBV3_CLOTT|nr:HAMP domain-containing methyl-accepting chemotaxis protein [Clostridium tetanomorphum]KAJ53917.1 methyl-accepting chemotaxis sensory transducer [Clostridium tetanomorphum DSM 665]MBC2398099.1 HAMP domain-containing protein [Clostridium tetanomorphum]MBP1864668.1 methyl-accepting chemotaxis protein [Clostridium tetanomorphum]NRS84138.1 methyl-accepting chemotaxis protein [Clostridium tetanomorphum]NRZ97351.1 methyl-accepting chemotaxis protein [Clostridium tetanomorphum]